MALWTPALIGSALKAWWYAPDIAQADGSAVTSWTDRSGNGNTLAQGTGANQPTYKTAIQNGLAVVRLDGTSDFMDVTSVGIAAQPYTCAAALSYGGALAADERLWSSRVVDTSLMRALSGGNFEIYGGTVRGYAVAATGWHVHTGVFNGASSSGSLDGTNVALASPGVGTPTSGIRLGVNNAGNSSWLGGDVGEVLFTSTAVSAADRQKLEGYLAWGWGLQANLAAGHPYLNGAPTTGVRGLRRALGSGLRNRTLGSW